MRQLDAQKR